MALFESYGAGGAASHSCESHPRVPLPSIPEQPADVEADLSEFASNINISEFCQVYSFRNKMPIETSWRPCQLFLLEDGSLNRAKVEKWMLTAKPADRESFAWISHNWPWRMELTKAERRDGADKKRNSLGLWRRRVQVAWCDRVWRGHGECASDIEEEKQLDLEAMD